jgi:glutathione S-transferase
MSYTLYYHPNTASLSAHWLLVELERALGVTYQLKFVDFDAGEQRSASYLAVNPKGRVPTLVASDVPYTEQAAILLTLSELHTEAGLVPMTPGAERAALLETIIFLANTLLPALRDWVYADKDGSEEGAKAVRQLARTRINQAWALLDQQLEGHDYLQGDTFSIADILAGSTVSWTKGVEKMALDGRLNVQAWVKRIRERSTWAEVKRREDGWVVREPPFEKDLV